MEKKTFTGSTVDEALTAAAVGLGIPSERLGYTVISEGSKGFLGLIGKKEAEITAWDKTQEENEPEEEKKVEIKAEEVKAPVKTETWEQKKETAPAKKPEAVKKPEETKAPEKKEEPVKKEEKIKTTANDAQHFEEGKAFLADIFEKMGMNVQIDYQYDEEENSLDINLSGEEMGVLIGKRGQTLDSLQYLTSLVVNRSGEHYIRIKLDTENYRERRKETLESLAKNIAYKVKRTRRSVSLEPMNPYERRIIHSTLQQDNFVMTKSEGEEPYRHVVVFYRRNRNGEER